MTDKRGRPEILDDTKSEIVIALISVGCSLKSAAQYLGIHPRSLRRHVDRDLEFAKRVARAKASVEWGHLRKVKEASGKSWRASAWMLERINPERFSRRREDSLSRMDLEDAINVVACIIAEEVDDPSVRNRIFTRFQKLVQDFNAQGC